jgi:hypothetical protein
MNPCIGLVLWSPAMCALGHFMPNQPVPETELLRAAYAAFNARDIDRSRPGFLLKEIDLVSGNL